MAQTFSSDFLAETAEILQHLDSGDIESVTDVVVEIQQQNGRLFFIGSGGGAGHASHATCDFRKLARIESYAVTDNVSELTARINDDGWDTSYSNWLKASHINRNDGLFVFSVGGGDIERNISPNLVRAMELAKEVGAKVVGVAGRDGGALQKLADACIVIPTVNEANVTPHTEGLQAVMWHLIVSHPKLQPNTAKWESSNTEPVTA